MASTAANLYYKPDKHAAFFAVKPWLITGGDKEENHGVLKNVLRNILARVCVNKMPLGVALSQLLKGSVLVEVVHDCHSSVSPSEVVSI